MVVEKQLTRPWRGVAPEQRVAERRERLLAAGLEVFTAQGFHGAKVRDVCREAGLTERYFYESFAGKEALLVALAEQIVADLVTSAGPGIALFTDGDPAAFEVVATAVVASLTDDPRRARILFVEVVGVSPAIEDRRREIIGSINDVIRHAIAGAYGEWALASAEIDVIGRALIGAAQELLVAYARGELALGQPALVRNLVLLFAQGTPLIDTLARPERNPA